MSNVLHPITACLKKGQDIEDDCPRPEEKDENDKTVENAPASDAASKPSSLMWRVSSSMYNIGSGVVGFGVSGAKLAASTTLSVGTGVAAAIIPVVGSGVISATQAVVSKVYSSAAPKPKKE